MSRLFFNETGRMLLHANEEIARWRWARKRLRLPAMKPNGAAKAELWLCVRSYPGNRAPLLVEVNGRAVASLRPRADASASSWEWRGVALNSGVLRRGDN